MNESMNFFSVFLFPLAIFFHLNICVYVCVHGIFNLNTELNQKKIKKKKLQVDLNLIGFCVKFYRIETDEKKPLIVDKYTRVVLFFFFDDDGGHNFSSNPFFGIDFFCGYNTIGRFRKTKKINDKYIRLNHVKNVCQHIEQPS